MLRSQLKSSSFSSFSGPDDGEGGGTTEILRTLIQAQLEHSSRSNMPSNGYSEAATIDPVWLYSRDMTQGDSESGLASGGNPLTSLDADTMYQTLLREMTNVDSGATMW